MKDVWYLGSAWTFTFITMLTSTPALLYHKVRTAPNHYSKTSPALQTQKEGHLLDVSTVVPPKQQMIDGKVEVKSRPLD